MALSKVSKKGLVSIPAEVRSFLNIEEGDYLVWDIDRVRKVVVIRVLKNPYKYLKGKYSDPNLIYERVEEEANRIVEGEVHANNRA